MFLLLHIGCQLAFVRLFVAPCVFFLKLVVPLNPLNLNPLKLIPLNVAQLHPRRYEHLDVLLGNIICCL